MENTFRLFPVQASTVAPHVDYLFFFILAVDLFFTVLIAGLIFVFAIQYRRRSEDYIPKPIIGSHLLESLWSIIPLFLMLGMFAWGAIVYFEIVQVPEDATEVYVTGKQWMWHLQHPEGQSEINELHIPVGRPVKLIMTSEDVIHDFSVPVFRVKQDVLPGRYTTMWFNATTTGRFHLQCVAYCGTEHAKMVGWVTVMEPADYEQWLVGEGGSSTDRRVDRSLSAQGRKLFAKLQCVSCHTGNAEARAPTLEELYGSRVQLDDGRSVKADEGYIRESILKPQAKVVAGWKPIMPTFQGQVTSEELTELIAYIKSMRRGDTPPRVGQDAPPVANSKTMVPAPQP